MFWFFLGVLIVVVSAVMLFIDNIVNGSEGSDNDVL